MIQAVALAIDSTYGEFFAQLIQCGVADQERLLVAVTVITMTLMTRWMCVCRQSGKPFPGDVTDQLEDLYRRGMTGWGKSHVNLAIASTGLKLAQIKV